MTHALVLTSSWTLPVMAPSIGEVVAAGTVVAGEQPLGNQLQYLSSSMFATSGTLALGTQPGNITFPTITRSIAQQVITEQGQLASGWTVGGLASGGQVIIGPGTSQTQHLGFVRVHHGATLVSVTVYFIVGQAHANVPQNLPSIQFLRTTMATGGLVQDTLGASQGPAAPGSGAAWFNSGNVQSFTYVCSQNNVIDAGLYWYSADLIDENGTNSLSGNEYIGMVLNFSGITTMQFE